MWDCTRHILFQLNVLVWQLAPLYPATHEHVYLFIPSLHAPPFWQGELLHSLISEKKTHSVRIELGFEKFVMETLKFNMSYYTISKYEKNWS